MAKAGTYIDPSVFAVGPLAPTVMTLERVTVTAPNLWPMDVMTIICSALKAYDADVEVTYNCD